MSASNRVRELIDLLAACGPSDLRALAFVRAELTTIADALAEPSPSDDRGEMAAASTPPPIDAATVADLADEAMEHLAETERSLTALASGAIDPATIDTCLRGFHSAKGAAGFLRLASAVRVLHAAETLLDAVRAGTVTLNPVHINLLLRSGDAVALCLATQGESDGTSGQRLDALADELQQAIHPFSRHAIADPTARSGTRAPHAADTASAGVERSVRISVDRTDALTALVKEVESCVGAITRDTDAQTTRLTDTVARLRSEVDALRLSSLRLTVQNLTRLVHDLSTTLGKPISLHAEGDDLEFDRSIVQALADPLRHLVRNACDHGIEAASDRRAAAKPPEGQITLRVLRQDSSLVVEVSDDGRGLDRDRIIARAIAGGLLTDLNEGASLPDDDVCRLVLAPGLTTATRATEVSGCGFGLDIVHRRAATLGGALDLRSAPGRGTTVSLTIPLAPDARLQPGRQNTAA